MMFFLRLLLTFRGALQWWGNQSTKADIITKVQLKNTVEFSSFDPLLQSLCFQ